MKWTKYPKKISKDTNIAFVVIYGGSIIYSFMAGKLPDWRIGVLYTLSAIGVYSLMIYAIKKTVWDKKNNKP